MSRSSRWLWVLGIFLLLFLAVGVLAALSIGRGPTVVSDSILWVRLDSDLDEEDRRSPLQQVLEGRRLTLRDHLRVLREAADDDRISAVVVRLDGFGGGWAKAAEFRKALAALKGSGKPVMAYLEFGQTVDYYVAASAGKVVMLPTGVLAINGLLADVPFYKGTLDKVGVVPDMLHVGDYKSASETYTREDMSDPARESLEYVLDGLFGAFLEDVAADRKTTREQVSRAVDEGFVTASRAQELGLVDELAYPDELLASLGKSGKERDEEGARLGAAAYLKSLGHERGEKIGVVSILGVITSGESTSDALGGTTTGSDTVVRALRSAREDDSVRAVILRVDSPGGSGLASDVIWREVERTKEVKPVVASMSDYAASGGYYVSMGADAVVAEPQTITGSIGVIAGKFSLRGLYGKIGVNRVQIKRGANADLFTDWQEFTPQQRAMVQAQMKEFYDDFVQKAAQGRGLTTEAVHAVGQGRIWTGLQGKERGLVDEIGGMDRAVELARERAGIAPGAAVRLVGFPEPRGLLEALSGTAPEEAGQGMALLPLPEGLRAVAARMTVLDRLAREPYLFLEPTGLP